MRALSSIYNTAGYITDIVFIFYSEGLFVLQCPGMNHTVPIGTASRKTYLLQTPWWWRYKTCGMIGKDDGQEDLFVSLNHELVEIRISRLCVLKQGWCAEKNEKSTGFPPAATRFYTSSQVFVCFFCCFVLRTIWSSRLAWSERYFLLKTSCTLCRYVSATSLINIPKHRSYWHLSDLKRRICNLKKGSTRPAHSFTKFVIL